MTKFNKNIVTDAEMHGNVMSDDLATLDLVSKPRIYKVLVKFIDLIPQLDY